jgi:uncharacterized membrane protein
VVGGFIVLLAIVALILCGLIALIAGIVALVRINRSEGKLRGKGFAVAAIVIGLLLMLGLPVFGVVGAVVLGFSRFDSAKQAEQKEHDAMRAAVREKVLEFEAKKAEEEAVIGTERSAKKPPEYEEKKKADVLKDPPEAK